LKQRRWKREERQEWSLEELQRSKAKQEEQGTTTGATALVDFLDWAS
jgi:hypothetical protein